MRTPMRPRLPDSLASRLHTKPLASPGAVRPGPSRPRVPLGSLGHDRSTSRHDREAVHDSPCQDAARKAIDDRVQVELCSVDQPDDGRVDVPELVRFSRPDTHLGLRTMDAGARAAPGSLSHELVPCRRRREQATESLDEAASRQK